MSYNQKPSGASSSSGSAPNGPNNQTPQQVAKALAGIQQQMQNLVHGQSSLPQAAPADLNVFFQQQRFQNMFKQQQQQLLQQHFQQQMQQQQNKDRGGGGGEPLALTRTPAAADLLNKTYQQHHQQQANGSSATNPALASVNQQIQQQLQAFPPNIMQQLQAFQYQMQQQQQQQHPQQQQHLSQSSLQQAQSGQSQQLHGQTHQQQQKAALTTAAAAAHMQQLQQSLQQKYLSVAAAAAAGQTAGGAKITATPPPPPLTNQIKPPNLPASTQITAVSPVTSSSATAAAAARSSSAVSSLTASSATSKQVPPSISLVPSKAATTPPTLSATHQAPNKVGNIANKAAPPMVSSIPPPPFPTHYQKPSNAATVEATNNIANASTINSTKNAANTENSTSKSNPTEISSLPKQQQQQPSINTEHQAAKTDASASITLNANTVAAHSQDSASKIPVSLVQQSPQKTTENGNKSVGVRPVDPQLKDLTKSKETPTTYAADDISSVAAESEKKTAVEIPALTALITNKSTKTLQETETMKNAATTEVVKGVSGDAAVDSAAVNAAKECVKDKKDDILTIFPTSKATPSLIEKSTEVSAPADDVKEDEIKEKSVVNTNSKSLQMNVNKSTDKPNVDETKATALKEPIKENKSVQETTDLMDIEIIPISKDDDNNADVTVAPMSSAEEAEDTHKVKIKDIETKENSEDKILSKEKVNKTPDPPKEALEMSSKKEEVKNQTPTTTGEATPENNNSKKSKLETVKINENQSTSGDTRKKKHGQPTRTSKTSSSSSTSTSKSEQSKRSSSVGEDKRTLKQKPQDLTESPTSSLNDTLKSNDRKSQRHRLKTILYQSPLPELAYITKLSASEASNSPKPMSVEDKLIVFYKNEYMAVRNAEGTFYLCQTMQNVYRTSPRISIRWLSEDKKDSSIFIPDFYDHTDIECVLTTVELKRVDKSQLRLPKAERARIESILKKAIDVEKGLVPRPDITEENPDGLDISLYKDESQIEKKSSSGSTPSSSSRRKRRSGATNTPRSSSSSSMLKADATLKRGTMSEAKTKTPNKKKRKTLIKKKKSVRKNNSSDEDVSSDEESDAEYKPNQKKTNTSSTCKSPRAQRSPLAKARAASPITPTSSKTTVPPQTSSPSAMANSRIIRSNKRKFPALEIQTDIAMKKLSMNLAKTTILKSKDISVEETPVSTTANRKSNDATYLVISEDNSPSTSADAAAASAVSCSGQRPTRYRK